MDAAPLILASASPRRQELLSAAGYVFTVIPSEVEEIHDARMAPEELTVLNALRKACDISNRHHQARVLGADTLVYLHGEPLGKPVDLADAAAMLRRLAGRQHTVCTGICLAVAGQAVATTAVLSHVRFGSMTDETIARYHRLVNPLDKAGAYGFQQHADLLQAEVDGPVDNVIGLPMDAVDAILDSNATIGRNVVPQLDAM